MLESKFLKENIENIQRLMSIQALKHFETGNLGKLLRLSKIRQYEDGEQIIQEGDMDPGSTFCFPARSASPKRAKIGTLTRKGEIFGVGGGLDRVLHAAAVGDHPGAGGARTVRPQALPARDAAEARSRAGRCVRRRGLQIYIVRRPRRFRDGQRIDALLDLRWVHKELSRYCSNCAAKLSHSGNHSEGAPG